MSTTTDTALQSVQFDAPLVNPAPNGLYSATNWDDSAGPSRFLGSGVTIRPHNYGGSDAFGVWEADWCVSPDDLTASDVKDGIRPSIPNPFTPIVVWAFDECDLTVQSQAEVRETVQQVLRLREQPAAETDFAVRLLSDVGTAQTESDLAAALGYLEGLFAQAGTVGLIHASAALAAPLANAQLVLRSSAGLRSPLGHQWVFGGGYVDGLGSTLVATSPTFGWRSDVTVRTVIDHQHNDYIAIAERAVVVGYEKALGAAKVGA